MIPIATDKPLKPSFRLLKLRPLPDCRKRQQLSDHVQTRRAKRLTGRHQHDHARRQERIADKHDLRMLNLFCSTAHPVAMQEGILRELIKASVQRKGGDELQHPNPDTDRFHER